MSGFVFEENTELDQAKPDTEPVRSGKSDKSGPVRSSTGVECYPYKILYGVWPKCMANSFVSIACITYR